jgi:hypothetical protein
VLHDFDQTDERSRERSLAICALGSLLAITAGLAAWAATHQ